MCFRCAPPQTGLVKSIVDIGERSGREGVDVIGKVGLGEIVAHHWRNAGSQEHCGRVGDRTPNNRQRVGALLVDVGGQ